MMVYFKASANVEMTSGLLIFTGFLIQQFYFWLREATRVWAYASQFDYYLMYHKDSENSAKDLENSEQVSENNEPKYEDN